MKTKKTGIALLCAVLAISALEYSNGKISRMGMVYAEETAASASDTMPDMEKEAAEGGVSEEEAAILDAEDGSEMILEEENTAADSPDSQNSSTTGDASETQNDLLIDTDLIIGIEIEEIEMEVDVSQYLETEAEPEKKITNEQLVARQNIVVPPDISLEFRFIQVEKNYAVVKALEDTSIYEEKDAGSIVVGTIERYGICYILEDKQSDWIYVESGNVRGFIAADKVLVGDEADHIVAAKGEANLPEAVSNLSYSENDAYTYTHTTVYPVVVDKVYGLAEEACTIYEEPQETARSIGTLAEGGLCYILEETSEDWVYVESGESRGFVQTARLLMGQKAGQAVAEKGEENLAQASTIVCPEKNKACYYTLTSIREASKSSVLRSDLVNFSFQFLGNPYVWGGTSLTDGCDCSGFTQSLYAHFGYFIPRVAEAQAVCGMQIPIASAVPGDLIFYAKDGEIYHVSMYIGNGQVIHALGKQTGVTITGIGSSAVWAVRVIQ